MSKLPQSLSYHIFTDRWQDHQEAVALYERVYDCWHTIWSQTFREIKGLEHLFSDEFDRQDEVTAIFEGNRVIGVFCYGWHNFQLRSHLNHSYFKAYPPETLAQLKELGAHLVMSMGNLAVVPEWRKVNNGIIADGLIGLGCKRFLSSDCDHLIAYTRNDRKVNQLCYGHGAKCLKSGYSQHNVEVDIIAIDRKTAVLGKTAEVSQFVENLWERRVVHGERTVGRFESATFPKAA
ncbi:MAG: hypothetical protein AB7F86_00335 [Bdellovibrionales bacterium]